MKQKRARLSEEDIKFARESELSISDIADILRCSEASVRYYRLHNGIWRKKR